MKEKLKLWAESKGMRIAAGNIDNLEEVRVNLRTLKDSGDLNTWFYGKCLRWLEERPENGDEHFKSIIVAALPRPAHILTFKTDDGEFESIIPPTYVQYENVPKLLLGDLNQFLGTNNGEFQLLKAPLKSLAVRLGLASYGRNNITYIDGLGSYFQLAGFITKQEIEPFIDSGIKADFQMKLCSNCEACKKVCPTKAIKDERFLLHAEDCLTLYSEEPGGMPELETSGDNGRCIIGCLSCQESCPANSSRLKYEKVPVSFTSEETKRILDFNGERSDDLWKTIRQKLDTLGMIDCELLLCRNLHSIIQ